MNGASLEARRAALSSTWELFWSHCGSAQVDTGFGLHLWARPKKWPARVAASPFSDLVVAALGRDDAGLLDTIFGNSRSPRYPSAIRAPVKQVLESVEGKEHLRHLAFLCLFKELSQIKDPKQLSRIDFQKYRQAVPEALRPEVDIVQFEAYLTQKDERAGQLKQAIVEKYPGLKWRIEEAERGKGLIGQL